MTQPSDAHPTGGVGCLATLARLTWLLVGNLLLFLLLVLIGRHRGFSPLDVAFWGTVAAIILIRLADVTRLGGETADGKPATLRHWRRHALLLLLVSGIAWVAAHLI